MRHSTPVQNRSQSLQSSKHAGAGRRLDLLWLSNNRLSGTIPPELGQLSALKLLWLQENRRRGGEFLAQDTPRWKGERFDLGVKDRVAKLQRLEH